MGDQVSDGQEVCFCGRPVQKEKEMILIALNKPAGIVCTAEKREKNNVIDFLHYPKRIYPVGRLDKESEGRITVRLSTKLCGREICMKKNILLP